MLKRTLSIMILVSLLISATACNKDGTDKNTEKSTDSASNSSSTASDTSDIESETTDTESETTDTETEAEPTYVSIVENGKSEYKLVINKTSSNSETDAARNFYSEVKSATDKELSVAYESAGGQEIIFGIPMDEEDRKLYSSLDYDEYLIQENNEKIIITAGCPAALDTATEVFMERFADKNEKTISVMKDVSIKGTMPEFTLPTLKENVWNVFDYGDTNVEYGILLPKDYDSSKQYPYFIYVHGHGYGGDSKQGRDWSEFQAYLESIGVLEGEGVHDCVIIAPHLKVYQGEASWWSNAFNLIGWAPTDIPYDTTPPSDNLIDMYTLIRQVGDALNIDEKRVYITGASDGGYATWELITRFTDFFTAAIPLCGGADTTKAHILKDLPICFFHGTADKTVSVEAALKMEKALRDAGSEKFIYKPLANLDHGISQAAYETDGLWEWLFSFTK